MKTQEKDMVHGIFLYNEIVNTAIKIIPKILQLI